MLKLLEHAAREKKVRGTLFSYSSHLGSRKYLEILGENYRITTIKGEFPIELWYALVKIAPSVYKSVQVY